MKSHDEMINEWMQDPEFKKEYDALEPEFAKFDELIKARNKTNPIQVINKSKTCKFNFFMKQELLIKDQIPIAA